MNDNLHSAHCRACKERVRELLTASYGECRVNQQFPWPAHPQAYANTAMGNQLERIRDALADWRGHRDFIKSAMMPPCDYFIPDPPFIVEFDENQHFSRARWITLTHYPEEIALGYSHEAWINLCEEINAVDDTPIDRDERRAWYDTLRDLLPSVQGFKPTVRLYAGASEWCTLDATNPANLAAFRQLCRNRGQSGVRFRT